MKVWNSFNLNKGNAVQDNFITWKLEITFCSNFKTPKCGKLSEEELKWYSFLKLQKSILLSERIIMVNIQQIIHFYTFICFIHVSSLFSTVTVATEQGLLPLMAGVSERRTPRADLQHCLGSPSAWVQFLILALAFLVMPGKLFMLSMKPSSPLYMEMDNSICFIALLRGYNGWTFTECGEWCLAW